MGIRVRYFAWVRERTGVGEEDVELPPQVTTVGELIGWLRARGPEYAAAFERQEVIRSAVDQIHASHSTDIRSAREIAFFPPVTGG